ncbi:restriction endonuclease subunit S [Magnetospirillum gryphiswaldense]|uniref:restriction endonuclease subunit S n=1 Tax=Magnetospirillum gryphiswaldense TaxID=55518 RepID=UPI000D038E0B|nr:restriction endonuclease subunit S [Magnetospirillum gryphiswaldense]AVM76075.1 EcoKI restriction-modification system protein HsdS [Magnetospirillum gryphiswaldense MSR-1]AVM79978.1 EcoKI restriction-modification system protein HsdS [Magnetospirillum gryphiswaldense]
MSFPRYPDYKDSGVEWLGEVPGHWRLTKLKWLFRFVKRQDCEDAPVLSVYRDYGVIEKTSRDDNNNKTPEDLSLYQTVQVGDLVINKMKAWQGSLGVSDLFGITSPDYAVFEKVHDGDGRFLHHLLRSRAMPGVYQTISNGIRPDQWRLEPDKFGQLLIPLPSVSEQSAIAAFLDRETAKIDALVAEQEKLIELLKEKRQAVISHAVTKGLDPSVPMKDSGIEWLGEVPAHWEMKPFKHLSKIGNGSTPLRDEPRYWENGTYPWLNSSVVNYDSVQSSEAFITETALDECSLPRIKPPAVLVGLTGEGRTRGMAATLLFEATINQHVAYIKPLDERLHVSYARRFLDMAYGRLRFESDGGGSTKGAITCEQLCRTKTPLPPPDEQAAISSFLDLERERFDTLTAEAQRAIELLKEHRSALISAAVTGKIDVRGLVSPQEAA